jgi:hypothetical protein
MGSDFDHFFGHFFNSFWETTAMGTRWLWMVALAVVVSVTGGGLRAGDAWICSVSSAVAVDEDGTVGPPDLGERERPTFLRIDPVKKELTLLAPASRRGEVTTLDLVHEVEGSWILSGVEHGRNVSIVITAEGRMTLSVVADGVVWSVFGHALPEGEAAEPVAKTEEPAAKEPVAEQPAPAASDTETAKPADEPAAAAEDEAATAEDKPAKGAAASVAETE